ncbi:beta-ketoacyl-[acyl-carrier-protein] synthase family protein [Enterococcus sp.]|uniref:beta-ketoacyl-[acyl-carrier-protein] synthase family protein n=1 Tax=Enterococcus sp. TaxID=35783 RepID=UPI00290C829E|nr:beta-ketoacyl-[acyl-carrier-protein] synthase family protein [Enterococcus sp.]MDU5337110.1 beta-ketoacyl-[acyl-carrier-protein] synthase family protein [Enterococcus sp.]
MSRRVVITGLGPVNQLGIGCEEFFGNLYGNAKSITKKIPDSLRERFKIRSKFYIPKVESSDLGLEKKYSRLVTDNSLLAIKAAELAIDDSGLMVDKENEISVILGIAVNHLGDVFENYENYINGAGINRMISPMSMPNAPSAWISIALGLYGDNQIINTACASSTYAIGEGFRKIRNGHSDVVICGGLEYLFDKNLSMIKNFDSLTVLDKSDNGIPLPFSKKRSGFLFNEGSGCCLVLEDYESAMSRNANIYCEIVNYESLCEAHSVLNIKSDGFFVKKMLKDLIGNEKIDYYNAHGTGTKLNDEVETRVFIELFGDKATQPLINSTKGFLGHSLGASGAIEAAVCAHSIKNNVVHKNNIVEPIENLRLVPQTAHCEINTAISASYGFGGHNGALLFKKI